MDGMNNPQIPTELHELPVVDYLQIMYCPMLTAEWPLLGMGWSCPAGATGWHWSDTVVVSTRQMIIFG